MQISEFCVQLIQYFEGFYTTPYICPGGYPTIGYGHKIVGNEVFSSLTKREAHDLLLKDLEKLRPFLLRLVHVPVRLCQWEALISFCYNVGPGAFQRSTLRSQLNRQEYGAAAEEFEKWIWAGGRRLKGLQKRRWVEKTVFLSQGTHITDEKGIASLCNSFHAND